MTENVSLGVSEHCLSLCQTETGDGDDRSWQMSLCVSVKMCDKQLWSIRQTRRQTAVSRLAAKGEKSGERIVQWKAQTAKNWQTALTRPDTHSAHTDS